MMISDNSEIIIKLLLLNDRHGKVMTSPNTDKINLHCHVTHKI